MTTTPLLDDHALVADLALTDELAAVRGNARRSLLDDLVEDDAVIVAAEARRLVRVAEWADLTRAAAFDDLLDVATGLVPPAREGSWSTCPVDMAGVPVDELALAELATALRLSAGACRILVEDALELRERLPRVWRRVVAEQVPVWRARQVARRTRSLSDEAAAYVDEQVAHLVHGLSAGRLRNLVDATVARFDPDRAAAEAAAASERRGVWTDHEHGGQGALTGDGAGRPNGLSLIEAVVSTPDALAFDAALDRVAADLAALGDDDSLEVRRSRAFGILADPQHALDLQSTAESAGADCVPGLPARAPSVFDVHRPIHVHLHTDSATARITSNGLPHAASPVSEEAIRAWLRELCPGSRVTVTPVIDLNGDVAVDAYEAPARVRARVEERDHLCVFPHCSRRGRFDLDHIEPYLDPDEGGPPGQTSAAGLAKLCRFHHRVKTHGGWRYQRVPGDPGAGPVAAYVWRSPLDQHFLVDGTGTHHLD